MPIDIFAALGALVRAEAARTTPKPPAARTAPEAMTPGTEKSTTQSTTKNPDSPKNPDNPKKPDSLPTQQAGAPPAATDPPAARKRLVARILEKLAALFRRRP